VHFVFDLRACVCAAASATFGFTNHLAKAKADYDDFFEVWKFADPDVPLLKQARAEYLVATEKRQAITDTSVLPKHAPASRVQCRADSCLAHTPLHRRPEPNLKHALAGVMRRIKLCDPK
jgi:hypothetical protein